MKRRGRVIAYFTGWIMLALVAGALNAWNLDWSSQPIWHGVIYMLVLGVLQGSVLELVVITVATLLVGKRHHNDPRAICDNIKLVLNYNLLAMAKEEIEETYERMYAAYMGNLHPNVAAVLVSATGSATLRDHELQCRDNYRALIYDTLYREGQDFAAGELRLVDPFRLINVWNNFAHLDPLEFTRTRLGEVCEVYAHDFMCLHRVSRVLKKCGQYQDLMLLSEGERLAYSYTDPALYGSAARPLDQPLFKDSDDVENLCGRRFNYTLVLDGDTRVPPGAALNLMAIAAAKPEAAIIQPSIVMEVDDETDTMFMLMENARQTINAPVTDALSHVLGQSGYYGKALIKNSSYIANVIGTRDHPIERVPIDVLSHDTFEAAVLKPHYAGSVSLLEAPPFNYVTWNIRERRWNKGEVLLSLYFWPRLMGKPFRWLQSKFQGDAFNKTTLRTPSPLDAVSSYIAHSALRQMFMKPLLLVYMVLHINLRTHYPYIPICAIMFLILVFPKFATCTRSNFKVVLLETFVSVLQFTPETVVGCVRLVRAYQSLLCRSCNWTPQRAVEEEFRRKNPMLTSLKHLWGYSLIAVLAAIPIGIWYREMILIFILLITLFLLPIYTGVTSYTRRLRRTPLGALSMFRDNLARSLDSLAGISRWSLEELGNLTNPGLHYSYV